MLQDLSFAQLKPVFGGCETRLKFIKFGLSSVKWPCEATETLKARDFQNAVNYPFPFKIDGKIKKFVEKN